MNEGQKSSARPARTARRQSMVTQMCAAVDAGEAESFGSWFAEDATYRFANADPLTGREAVIAATADASRALPWVRHTVDQVAEVGDQLFCRFTIETEAADGAHLSLPCLTVIELDGAGSHERIIDYRVHMDINPALATPN